VSTLLSLIMHKQPTFTNLDQQQLFKRRQLSLAPASGERSLFGQCCSTQRLLRDDGLNLAVRQRHGAAQRGLPSRAIGPDVSANACDNETSYPWLDEYRANLVIDKFKALALPWNAGMFASSNEIRCHASSGMTSGTGLGAALESTAAPTAAAPRIRKFQANRDTVPFSRKI